MWVSVAACLCAVFGCRGGTSGIPSGESSSSDATSIATSEEPTTSSGAATETSADPSESSEGSSGGSEPGAWDPEPTPLDCVADPRAPLLAEALDHAGLTADRFGYARSDFEESSQYQAGVLGGDFVLSWFADARARPITAGCVEADTAAILDAYLTAPHPVAGLLRRLATTIDRPPDDALPMSASSFEQELAALCDLVGSPCDDPQGELPDELAAALAPVLAAIAEGIAARLAMDAAPGGDPQFWFANGGNMTLLEHGPVPSPADSDVRAYLLGHDERARLYRAASQIAFAIEDVDWSAFAGRRGIEFTLPTNAGRIVVRDAGDHVYAQDEPAALLLLDLGGRDEHFDEVAANRSAANPVSIAIDLDGADVYGYDAAPSPGDHPNLPPADADGRSSGGQGYGAYTLSDRFRQGAARNGIAMLFDLSDADDEYRSLRGSQGAAHLGVGVLWDGGGDDTYVAEANAQGSAQFGIGLAVDAGDGSDRRSAFTFAQGFGFVGGAGVLVDGGGNDEYLCDIGDPTAGGLPVYLSPQRPDNGNSSFCQGAGFGSRNDTSALSSLSGGLGILRDAGGDDSYDASVFAQGAGYWEGIGILSDADGSDRYDAYWYVQGAAAHYAVGMLVDGGEGDDSFDLLRSSQLMTLGAGHDFSLGVLLGAGGNDRYFAQGLSVGASNCNGIGLFVDNAGDDEYVGVSDLGSGVGNVSAECLSRPDAVSIGIMLDAAGIDSYDYPFAAVPEFIVPADDGTWGYARAGLPSEHGGGRDSTDGSGVQGSD